MQVLFTVLNFVAVFPLSTLGLEMLSENEARHMLHNYYKKKV